MNFDEIIERRGTHSQKWDMMEKLYGVSPDDGIPMWVADMDFKPPQRVTDALRRMVDHGVFGYFGDDRDYKDAIRWWMGTRHKWVVEPEWIFSTHGLVNGTGICVDAFTEPGDGIVLTTPVYHSFARVIKAAKRAVVECELAIDNGRYAMDFDAWDAQMTGKERMFILCSPHNPGGRVWTEAELRGVAEFCKRHDLILVSDEIHHDLVYPGETHIAMPLVEAGISDRLIVMTATTKTFNIAGAHTGNVIIPDERLRARFAERMVALGISPSAFGPIMAAAAYSQQGAEWVDELMLYLDGNRKIFDDGMNAIPGVVSMHLQATYLAWVDFAGTGMSQEELTRRVAKKARIAASSGPSFGKGGETYLRFNLGTRRALVEEAVSRLRDAFSDLQ